MSKISALTSVWEKQCFHLWTFVFSDWEKLQGETVKMRESEWPEVDQTKYNNIIIIYVVYLAML